MLADKLDEYKERENKYVDNNIKKIQGLYRDKEIKKKFKGKEIQDKKVLLFKLYKKSTRSDTKSSFIQDEVNNLEKHMKFIQSLMRTRIFRPPPIINLFEQKTNKIADSSKK